MSNEIQVSNPATFQITSFEQAERFAKMFAQSDFAPKDFRGKPANVLIAMQLGNELGLKPIQALQNIAVVNGRSCVWGDLALALVRANPECNGVKEWIEGSIKDGTAIAYCEVTRKNEVITESFSIEMAKRAGLWGKQGPWSQYPERMLAMRARGFALRNAFPDALKGLYIKEEMEGSNLQFQSLPDNEPTKPINDVEETQITIVDETSLEIEDLEDFMTMIDTCETTDALKAVAEIIKSSGANSNQKKLLGARYKEKLEALK